MAYCYDIENPPCKTMQQLVATKCSGTTTKDSLLEIIKVFGK